ncbi:MAG TPA: hypothetical protein VKT72_02295 [Candidatus Baltobacteraceae bacterium]|nr:hypothetical protein [Candidatus Baltobacteraceae bacterium]
MTTRQAALLTNLYSRSWRARYGREFQALLLELPLTPAVATDVLLKAFATRRDVLAIFAVGIFAAISVVTLAGHGVARTHPIASATIRPRVVALCRRYSSVAKTQFIAKSQCLT